MAANEINYPMAHVPTDLQLYSLVKDSKPTAYEKVVYSGNKVITVERMIGTCDQFEAEQVRYREVKQYNGLSKKGKFFALARVPDTTLDQLEKGAAKLRFIKYGKSLGLPIKTVNKITVVGQSFTMVFHTWFTYPAMGGFTSTMTRGEIYSLCRFLCNEAVRSCDYQVAFQALKFYQLTEEEGASQAGNYTAVLGRLSESFAVPAFFNPLRPAVVWPNHPDAAVQPPVPPQVGTGGVVGTQVGAQGAVTTAAAAPLQESIQVQVGLDEVAGAQKEAQDGTQGVAASEDSGVEENAQVGAVTEADGVQYDDPLVELGAGEEEETKETGETNEVDKAGGAEAENFGEKPSMDDSPAKVTEGEEEGSTQSSEESTAAAESSNESHGANEDDDKTSGTKRTNQFESPSNTKKSKADVVTPSPSGGTNLRNTFEKYELDGAMNQEKRKTMVTDLMDMFKEDCQKNSVVAGEDSVEQWTNKIGLQMKEMVGNSKPNQH